MLCEISGFYAGVYEDGMSSGMLRRVVEVDRRVRGAYCLLLKMDVVRISEPSVYFYGTTRRSIPEDSHLHDADRFNSY
jgi:hypothetical protein